MTEDKLQRLEYNRSHFYRIHNIISGLEECMDSEMIENIKNNSYFKNKIIRSSEVEDIHHFDNSIIDECIFSIIRFYESNGLNESKYKLQLDYNYDKPKLLILDIDENIFSHGYVFVEDVINAMELDDYEAFGQEDTIKITNAISGVTDISIEDLTNTIFNVMFKTEKDDEK